jgi:hypothetical protein
LAGHRTEISSIAPELKMWAVDVCLTKLV